MISRMRWWNTRRRRSLAGVIIELVNEITQVSRSSWGERARGATSAQMVQVERARLGFLGSAG
jgi:hypothetical protein